MLQRSKNEIFEKSYSNKMIEREILQQWEWNYIKIPIYKSK